MIDYAIRVKAEGDLLWFLAVAQCGEGRLSLSHCHTLLGVRRANFSVLGYELNLIRGDIERAVDSGEPVRLVRLSIVGSQDWMTNLDREIIEEALRETRACEGVP